MPEVTDPALIALLEQPQTKINEMESAGVGAQDLAAVRQEAIDKIKLGRSLIERSKNGWFTTGIGSGAARMVGATGAYDVAQDTETLKNAGALTRIMEMAKTNGGKNPLTPLSNWDFQALASSLSNLDPSQSDDQYQRNVERVIDLYRRAYEAAGGKDLDKELTGQAAAPGAGGSNDGGQAGGGGGGQPPRASPDGSQHFATDRDKAFTSAARQLFLKPNSTRADFDALAVSWGYDPYGGSLDKALDYRAKGGDPSKVAWDIPESGYKGPTLTGTLAASPLGSYAIGAANALTAGTLDEIVGAAGGDAERAQLAKEVAREAHPFASGAGELSGAAMAMLGVGRAPGVAGRALFGDTVYGLGYGAGENNDNRLGGAAVGATSAAAGSYFGGKLLDRLSGAVAPGRAAARVAQAKDYGIDMPLGAAGGRGSAIIDNTLSNMPGSAQVMQAGRDVLQNQVEGAVQDTAEKFGTARGVQAMGDALQAGARKWISRFEQTTAKAYDAVPIKPSETVWPANTTTALRDMTNAFSSNPKLAAAMKNSRLERFMDALGNRGGGSLLSWSDLKAFRSAIGEEIGERRFSDTIATSQLRRLYGALSDDMRAFAEAKGPAALRAFERANTLYRQGQERIDGALVKILGDDGKLNAEAAANRLLAMARSGKGSSDLARLAEVRKSMPADEWGDVAGSLVRLLGQPARSEGRDFSAETFVRNYDDMSDGAKNLLFSDRGREGLRSSLDGLVDVLRPIKERNALRNTSNTAGQVLTGSAFYMLGNLPALIGQAASSYGAARLWTNPRFVQWVTGYTRMMKGAQAAGGAPNVGKQIELLKKVAAAEPAIAAETTSLAQLLGSAANDNSGRIGAVAASPDQRPDEQQRR